MSDRGRMKIYGEERMQLNTIFQSLQQGILLCDANARILYFNDAYGTLIGHKLEEIKGRRITDFRPHALVISVIRSGEGQDGVIRREQNQEYFASVYPLTENGEIRGTISIVTTMTHHQLKVRAKGLSLEERVKSFERQEIEAELAVYGHDLEGKKKAAEVLGISLATLYNKIKESD